MRRILFLLCCVVPLWAAAQNTLGALNSLHQVEKGETLWGIAHRYGVAEEAILKANPEIKKNKVKKGMLLVIPPAEVPSIEMPPVVEEVAPEPVDLTLRVGVLLPLEDKNERAAKLVEFYQGLLMAVDSVKSEGADVEVYAYHSGTTAEAMQEVLRHDALKQMSLIFGPADAAQIAPLANFCQTNGVRLVLPFANNFDLSGQPLVYAATAGYAMVQQDAARMIAQRYPERNYVVLNTNNADTRGNQFVTALREELSAKGIAMRSLNIEGDDFAIEAALNQFRQNCIVPDNTNIRTLNVLFSRLSAFCAEHPEYKISVQGYPEWQTYTSSQLLDFYKFDTYIYSPYYRNPLLAQTEDFEQRFSANFRHPQSLTFPRYGMMGFDMGYYFLHGLRQLGHNFDTQQENMNFKPVQHAFHFARLGEGNGFVNHGMQLIHYTPEQTIKQIR